MHLSIIFKTTSEKIKTLSRISNALDEKQVKLLYSPFIMSQFNYCSITWIFCSKKVIKKLNKYKKKGLRHGLLNTRPYMSHLKAKIKRPVLGNLVLWIYEFLFNFGDGISKEKNSGSSENSKFKNDRNFQLTAYLITLFFLFVINKQVKTSAEAAIKIGVPMEKIKKQGKSLENNFDRVQLLVKLFAVGL